MEPDFSFLFHQSSKSLVKGHPPIPEDVNAWPEEWKTVYYKNYERLPKISLLDNEKKKDLFDAIKERKSSKKFADIPISLEQISLLLKYSCGNIKPVESERIMHRAQPSGGERYPIEVYPLVLKGEGDLKPGLYHYNVKLHALDVLFQNEFSLPEIENLFSYKWVQQASCVFLMTAVFYRNQMKYGERGYRYILIEAGHIGQNLYLLSEALGIKCRALGGTHDNNIEKLLDIDGINESLVYAVVVGK